MDISKMEKVAIAGASGFIGHNLIDILKDKYQIVALSRNEKESTKEIQWRKCDLFSLLDAEIALKNVDYAFYLVHSMMPSARLTQGNFADMDLIIADNFARAAKYNNVKQIIYLSGIIPDDEDKLSKHLKSRLEVEKTLSAYGVPVTTLRSSLIVGAGGSSFQILEKLVKRLPVMICPQWTLSMTQPIALDDVLKIMEYTVANEKHYNKSYDIGGPDIISYLDLIRKTAEFMELKRYIYTVPLISPLLSYLWLSLISNSPAELTKPLVESLRHNMTASDLRLQEEMGLQAMNYENAVRKAIAEGRLNPNQEIRFFNFFIEKLKSIIDIESKRLKDAVKVNDVRSVQRLPLPKGKNAEWVSTEYTVWLPEFMRPFIRVEVDEYKNCYFYALFIKEPLLVLEYSGPRSSPDRVLFYITGGILAKIDKSRRGRLEFREVLNGEYVLSAIHDFSPSLPWFIYNISQAMVHLWVMKSFCKYLLSLKSDKGFLGKFIGKSQYN